VLSARSGPLGGRGTAADAKVELIDRRQVEERRGAAPRMVGPQAAGQGPAVQVVGRPRGAGPVTSASSPGFDLSETMLTASLLEQYAERAGSIGDAANAAVATRALGKLAGNARPPVSAAPVIRGGAIAIPSDTIVEVIPAPTAPRDDRGSSTSPSVVISSSNPSDDSGAA
jgi:hypothetical protein